MQKMVCMICGHVFDPGTGDAGIARGMEFDKVPADWCCPVCGAGKPKFVPES